MDQEDRTVARADSCAEQDGAVKVWTLWLTGLPASGKTTLARHLRARLATMGVDCVILDSDEVRTVLTPNPTYSSEERDQFYRGLVDLAFLLTSYGVNVIIAATATWRAYREAARRILSPFAEVYVRCSIEVCRQRDPRGLYARADAGEITNLPGVGVPYEEPINPAVIVDTELLSPDEAADRVLAEIPMIRQPSQQRPLPVATLMTQDPVVVRPDETLAQAKKRLEAGDFHHLPVVNDQGELVGIVSQHDLFAAWVSSPQAAETAPVSSYMTPEPITIHPGSQVVEAIQLMLKHKIGCLPVLADGKLVGIITDRDILEWVAEYL